MKAGDGGEAQFPVAAEVEFHLDGQDDVARQQAAFAVGHGAVDEVVGFGGEVEVNVAAMEFVFVPLQAQAGIEGHVLGIDHGVVECQ